MNRKTKNTLALLGVLILLVALGLGYIYVFQKPSLKTKTAELTSLKALSYDPNELNKQLKEKMRKALKLDSILSARKFNIPKDLSSLKFYDFLNQLSTRLSEKAKFNIEYVGQKTDKEFLFFDFRVSGYGSYNDLYQLIYGIEESKELKKITKLNLSNYILAPENEEPEFLINYTMNVAVYFSANDRYATSTYSENNLRAPRVYDIFYPLIRTEIPPNIRSLLDVQGAKLLALVPDGAFLADVRGNSFLLIEGDEVYLGYLTTIDYKWKKVTFVLNKGGVVETVVLSLDRSLKK
ncbi:MAG: hypothetical protein COZ80_03575 [Ignavibacteria bacterium CG_4_8_14_3_um_filter_37_9]|nr:hypothetical protein [Ignavibacteria bacterium]OIO21015.1 MAG: hypothetical protein AUJ54_05050 [Ignavibacteria bacterium CG1_02_37_35]PIS45399.1 MAG: hypothetical protein COT22_05425 [Ignavibacteria bacterium CG08_land_8_20_14_0_20_37_9]PIW99790.1 MAG: hypothetical protein COZ80_03575 [Ignavibacteria bacterium CG_4_8_14_3_um_filter_37_9]PIX95071.1 MAG: hypothetical protein COZ25_02305 [Ignavibacteria bacterium CG_4_10_14_3_um_filter_37_18]PJC61148.1 MAG: hypothetical protein CO025_00535 [I